MISGVQTKRLIQHVDERGYFQENLRVTDPFFDEFGQWSQSLMWTGTFKAWHIHAIQTDYWIVPFGVIKAALCDQRVESSTYNRIDTFILGNGYDPILIKIPPGVAHGLKVLQGPAMLTYITSHIYDPEDEGRIAIDQIDYDWTL